jgi:hypothetical protein
MRGGRRWNLISAVSGTLDTRLTVPIFTLHTPPNSMRAVVTRPVVQLRPRRFDGVRGFGFLVTAPQCPPGPLPGWCAFRRAAGGVLQAQVQRQSGGALLADRLGRLRLN